MTVSSHLANDRFDSLTDLIDPIALKEIRSNYEKLSLAQREEFSMKQSDILMTMINSIDIQSINDGMMMIKIHNQFNLNQFLAIFFSD